MALNKEAYIETVFEMLDEMNWGYIRWAEEDEGDFIQLLGDAWDRADRHTVDEVQAFKDRTQEIVDHFAAHMPKAEDEVG